MHENFENYISLGYFCEVAQDLEKLGLRNQSSPFDWGISYFPNVIDAIDKCFDGFMDKENLSQNINSRGHYHDNRYHFYFFHDFDKYKSLDEQYPLVREKYYRRIERFINSIQEPTLFVRYISTEELDDNGKSTELVWIENNIDYINNVIKRFNPENEIIYIGDETLISSKIKIYNVPIDENDRVSRSPIINNRELFPILTTVDFPGKEENKIRYIKKDKIKKSYITKIKNKIFRVYQKMFLKEYIHSKTYDVADK